MIICFHLLIKLRCIFSQSLFHAWCWGNVEFPIYNIYWFTGEGGWNLWKDFSVLAPSSSFLKCRLLLHLYKENCLGSWKTSVVSMLKLDCLFVHMKWKNWQNMSNINTGIDSKLFCVNQWKNVQREFKISSQIIIQHLPVFNLLLTVLSRMWYLSKNHWVTWYLYTEKNISRKYM